MDPTRARGSDRDRGHAHDGDATPNNQKPEPVSHERGTFLSLSGLKILPTLLEIRHEKSKISAMGMCKTSWNVKAL